MKFFLQVFALLCFQYFTLLSQEIDQESLLFGIEEAIVPNFTRDVECKAPHFKDEQRDFFDISQFEPVLSAECEPLTTVAGCVNVISGHFFQIDKDLVSPTLESLDLIRHYDSGNTGESTLGFGVGLQFPLWASAIQDHSHHAYAMISEREGFLIPYKGETSFTHGRRICSIDPRLLKNGYTNLSRAASGHANFVNWKAVYRNKESDWIIRLGDGSKRAYGKHVNLEKEHQRRMNFPSKEAYLLTQEVKPNGNRLLFSTIKFMENTALHACKRRIEREKDSSMN